MNQIENAVISGTTLGSEDHGIFSSWVTVEGSGWGCGFGGYAFDKWDEEANKRVGHAYGAEYIIRLLETLEVPSWEKLKGTHVRVETEGIGGRIKKIGHFLKDKWFDPEALASEMTGK